VHYEHEKEAAPARKAFVIIQCWPQMPLVEVTVELGNFRPYVSSWQEVIPPTSNTKVRNRQSIQALSPKDGCDLVPT
jgi:hypothetical protein